MRSLDKFITRKEDELQILIDIRNEVTSLQEEIYRLRLELGREQRDRESKGKNA